MHGRIEALAEENADLKQNVTQFAAKCRGAKTEVQELSTAVASFGQFVGSIESRRRMQDEARCQGAGATAMLTACCPATGGRGGHRRGLQGQGCAAFPAVCSSGCSALFVEYFEGCQSIIVAMPAVEKDEWDGFYSMCEEATEAMAVMLAGALPALMFHVFVLNDAADNQAAMFINGGSSPAIRPVVLPPIGPPPPPARQAPARCRNSGGSARWPT